MFNAFVHHAIITSMMGVFYAVIPFISAPVAVAADVSEVTQSVSADGPADCQSIKNAMLEKAGAKAKGIVICPAIKPRITFKHIAGGQFTWASHDLKTFTIQYHDSSVIAIIGDAKVETVAGFPVPWRVIGSTDEYYVWANDISSKGVPEHDMMVKPGIELLRITKRADNAVAFKCQAPAVPESVIKGNVSSYKIARVMVAPTKKVMILWSISIKEVGGAIRHWYVNWVDIDSGSEKTVEVPMAELTGNMDPTIHHLTPDGKLAVFSTARKNTIVDLVTVTAISANKVKGQPKILNNGDELIWEENMPNGEFKMMLANESGEILTPPAGNRCYRKLVHWLEKKENVYDEARVVKSAYSNPVKDLLWYSDPIHITQALSAGIVISDLKAGEIICECEGNFLGAQMTNSVLRIAVNYQPANIHLPPEGRIYELLITKK